MYLTVSALRTIAPLLEDQLKVGTVVASYIFKIPGWLTISEEENSSIDAAGTATPLASQSITAGATSTRMTSSTISMSSASVSKDNKPRDKDRDKEHKKLGVFRYIIGKHKVSSIAFGASTNE
jgi:hypothetical protein